jgi:hypothetical protein
MMLGKLSASERIPTGGFIMTKLLLCAIAMGRTSPPIPLHLSLTLSYKEREKE